MLSAVFFNLPYLSQLNAKCEEARIQSIEQSRRENRVTMASHGEYMYPLNSTLEEKFNAQLKECGRKEYAFRNVLYGHTNEMQEFLSDWVTRYSRNPKITLEDFLQQTLHETEDHRGTFQSRVVEPLFCKSKHKLNYLKKNINGTEPKPGTFTQDKDHNSELKIFLLSDGGDALLEFLSGSEKYKSLVDFSECSFLEEYYNGPKQISNIRKIVLGALAISVSIAAPGSNPNTITYLGAALNSYLAAQSVYDAIELCGVKVSMHSIGKAQTCRQYGPTSQEQILDQLEGLDCQTAVMTSLMLGISKPALLVSETTQLPKLSQTPNAISQRSLIIKQMALQNGLKIKRVKPGNEKVAIIGRSMGLDPKTIGVNQAANYLKNKGINTETFTGSVEAQQEFLEIIARYQKSVGNPNARVPADILKGSKLYKENEAWARKLRDENYQVIDLGDPNGIGRFSPFYALEKKILFNGE